MVFLWFSYGFPMVSLGYQGTLDHAFLSVDCSKQVQSLVLDFKGRCLAICGAVEAGPKKTAICGRFYPVLPENLPCFTCEKWWVSIVSTGNDRNYHVLPVEYNEFPWVMKEITMFYLWKIVSFHR